VNDEPNSERASETALLRREMDRDTRERLRVMESRMDKLEHDMTQQLHALVLELRQLATFNQDQKPALETLNALVRSGMAIRWLIVGVVGLLAAMATAATAWEALRKWLH
jgi:hypothetical protein